MSLEPPIGESIHYYPPRLTQADVDKFRRATRTEHTVGLPLTLSTLYRLPEFQWLERLGVDLRDLLHGDQEYTFLKDLKVDTDLKVRTTLSDYRERTGKKGVLILISLESEICWETEIAVVSKTTFVVKKSKHPGGS